MFGSVGDAKKPSARRSDIDDEDDEFERWDKDMDLELPGM